MARQPYLPKYQNERYNVGAQAINERPEFVNAIGRCLTLWPYVEHQLAMLLGVLMNADDAITVSIFTLLRTGRTQRDALELAAEAKLDPDQLRLFKAVMVIFTSVEKERADLAHGQWGILKDRNDTATWIESKHHAPWNTLAITSPRGHTHQGLKEKLYVYKLKDIDEVYEHILELWQILFDLLAIVRRDERAKNLVSGASERYARLIQLPRIQEVLNRPGHRQNGP